MEERQHLSDTGQAILYKQGIVAIHVVIVNHPNPPERERWYDLRTCRGISTHRNALRKTGIVALQDGIPNQPIVLRIEQRYKALKTRISKVLKLFVIRAVHVRLRSAKPSRSPPYLEILLEIRFVCG